MTDIVERLRREGENAQSKHLSMGMWQLCADAADEIERLRAALAEYENAPVRLRHIMATGKMPTDE